MISSDSWHKHQEWYFKIVIRNFTSRKANEIRDNFDITSGSHAKDHEQIMLLFVNTSTRKRFLR